MIQIRTILNDDGSIYKVQHKSPVSVKWTDCEIISKRDYENSLKTQDLKPNGFSSCYEWDLKDKEDPFKKNEDSWRAMMQSCFSSTGFVDIEENMANQVRLAKAIQKNKENINNNHTYHGMKLGLIPVRSKIGE